MISFNVHENLLMINDKCVNFKYKIYKAEEHENILIVLLEYKNNSNPMEFTNALYGISSEGRILWKMEDVHNVLGNMPPDPLVDFNFIDGKIVAADYCSRKFFISPIDGEIISYQTGRW